MADPIRGFFENQIGPDAPPIHTSIEDEERRRLEIAACALLLELAHADEEFSAAERAHIEEVIRAQFGLNADGARELLALSEAERQRGGDLHEFADLMRDRLDEQQKTRLVETMWSLALSDGEIAQHESFLMERVADRLAMSREDLARARQRMETKPHG